jgi:hypothetical protein
MVLRETLNGGAVVSLGPEEMARCLEDYRGKLVALGMLPETYRTLLAGYQAKLLEYFDVEMALPPPQIIKGDSEKPKHEQCEGLGG